MFTLAEGFHQHTFLSGAGDGIIAEWDMNHASQATGIAKIHANIFCLYHIKKHQLLVCGTLKGSVHIIELNTKKEIKNIGRYPYPVFDFYFHEPSNLLYICSENGILDVWKFPEMEHILSKQLSTKSLRKIIFHEIENQFIVASSDALIYFLDEKTLEIDATLSGHKNSVFSLCLSFDKKYLMSGSRDAQLALWNIETKQLETIIAAHLFTINDICISPDGKLIATAGRDKHIKLWDAATLELLKVIDFEKFGGHKHSVNKLFWSNYHNLLISCGDDKNIFSWSIN